MAHDFTMPKLGLTMTDGTIRKWLVDDGATVHAGEPVLLIETDKIETEVEARESGILTISGVVGETYECGAVLGRLLGEGEAAVPVATRESAPEPAAVATPSDMASPAQRTAAPDVTYEEVATRGQGGRILASPMARSAARISGVALANIVGTGPGGRIVADDVVGRVAAPAAPAAPRHKRTTVSTGDGGRILASPMARSAARDLDIDLAHILGTGPGGRIVAGDVSSFAAHRDAAPEPNPEPNPDLNPDLAPDVEPAADLSRVVVTPSASVSTSTSSNLSATGGGRMLAELLGIDLRAVPASSPGARVTREDVAAWVREQLNSTSTGATHASEIATPVATATAMPLLQEPSELVPLRGMRGVIAERMHASLTEMAQLTLSVDADMTAVNAERNRLKLADLPVPGYTAWVVAAASRALADHPCVNSQVTPDGVAYLPEIHLGVAVSLDGGLIVPVIKNANTLAVVDLHSAVADLAAKARDGKLELYDLEGGTFSVTALGMYGVDMFTPVINPPNTAILGVGRLRTETQWHDGVPGPHTVMTLSLTWDHRAFDGAPAAEFAQSLVRFLEDPVQLTG